jgi:CHAT domain-containing protein
MPEAADIGVDCWRGEVRRRCDTSRSEARGFAGRSVVEAGPEAGLGLFAQHGGELNGVASLAAKKQLRVIRYEGDRATTATVLEALPRAKVAHFATHGFFAAPSFRGLFDLDEKDFQRSWQGERTGRVTNNPLLISGLVFAGANKPSTPGRGILTGDQLIDRDLSGLELAVLSACKTGLGDVAGGEGVFGLQRAFHYAGTQNVVASLWEVPDAPTAALMNLFYTNLWEKNLSPLAALHAALLEIYRNPKAIRTLAAGFRGKFEEVKAGADQVIAPPADGKAHPQVWAAFSLAGLGR